MGRGSVPPRVLNLGTEVSNLTLPNDTLRTCLHRSEVTKLGVLAKYTCYVWDRNPAMSGLVDNSVHIHVTDIMLSSRC